MNKWIDYIKRNSKTVPYNQDCQLVTTVNAYYHLTGNIIEQGSQQYNNMAELAGCVYGSCIDITKVWKELGIWENKRLREYYDIQDHLTENCFIEASIWYKKYGCHSVAIVDYIEKSECVRVTNFDYLTSTGGWMFFEDLKPFLVDNPNKDKPYWQGRTFKLIEYE